MPEELLLSAKLAFVNEDPYSVMLQNTTNYLALGSYTTLNLPILTTEWTQNKAQTFRGKWRESHIISGRKPLPGFFLPLYEEIRNPTSKGWV